MFNRNTVKVSYSSTLNVDSIIKSHNKKLTNAESKQMKHCNLDKITYVRWKVNVDLMILYTDV